MKQSKILQATQIDERHIADIFKLPCVQSIKKILNGKELIVKGYSYPDEHGEFAFGYFAATDSDWLCHLQDGTWQVLTDEQYKAQLASS